MKRNIILEKILRWCFGIILGLIVILIACFIIDFVKVKYEKSWEAIDAMGQWIGSLGTILIPIAVVIIQSKLDKNKAEIGQSNAELLSEISNISLEGHVKFDIYIDKNGKKRARLVKQNGEVVGIYDVDENGEIVIENEILPEPHREKGKYVVVIDKNGNKHAHFMKQNGEIIGEYDVNERLEFSPVKEMSPQQQHEILKEKVLKFVNIAMITNTKAIANYLNIEDKTAFHLLKELMINDNKIKGSGTITEGNMNNIVWSKKD